MPGSTRRTFLASMTAAGAAAPLLAGTRRAGHRVPPQKILVLGGTGFLGPHFVRAALANGHTVTLFNRGKSDPGLFPDLEQLRGDRGNPSLSCDERAGNGGSASDTLAPGAGLLFRLRPFRTEVPSFLSAPT